MGHWNVSIELWISAKFRVSETRISIASGDQSYFFPRRIIPNQIQLSNIFFYDAEDGKSNKPLSHRRFKPNRLQMERSPGLHHNWWHLWSCIPLAYVSTFYQTTTRFINRLNGAGILHTDWHDTRSRWSRRQINIEMDRRFTSSEWLVWGCLSLHNMTHDSFETKSTFLTHFTLFVWNWCKTDWAPCHPCWTAYSFQRWTPIIIFLHSIISPKNYLLNNNSNNKITEEKKKEAAEVRTLNDRSSELALLMTKRKVYVIYIFRWKKMSFGTGQLKF